MYQDVISRSRWDKRPSGPDRSGLHDFGDTLSKLAGLGKDVEEASGKELRMRGKEKKKNAT
jgi:hypothetical protein